jgi:hypothetical protein
MQPDEAVAARHRHQHIAVYGVFELMEIRPQYERAFKLATASFALEPSCRVPRVVRLRGSFRSSKHSRRIDPCAFHFLLAGNFELTAIVLERVESRRAGVSLFEGSGFALDDGGELKDSFA